MEPSLPAPKSKKGLRTRGTKGRESDRSSCSALARAISCLPDLELADRRIRVAVGTVITHRPPHRSRRAAFPHRAPAGGRTRSAHEAFVPPRNAIRARAAPFETCGFRCCARGMQPHPCIPSGRAPSLHTLRRRSSRPCSGASSVLRARPTPHPFPDGLPLGFPPRPGIARATAGRMRSPRFRRLPFVRDGVFDHGRASAPRITAPHMLPSTLSTASASARLYLSRLNSPPHTIAVYASRRSSPSAPQHSLPSARYGLLGPDLHRLDTASFAWRTDNAFYCGP